MTGVVILIDRCVRCPFGYDDEEILCFADSYINGGDAREFEDDEVWYGEGIFDDGAKRLPRERPEWCILNKSAYVLRAA